MATRTADELAALKTQFTSTYTGDPAGLDAAFQTHLETLDDAAPAPAKKASTKKGGKKAAAKPAKKAAAVVKAPKAAKAPAKPKAGRGFRPTSDDRKTLNAAAAKVAGKDTKAPRLIPQAKGATYSDFLSGKVLKLDADGNGSAVLNVVSAKDTKAILGTVTATVSKGSLKATGAKA